MAESGREESEVSEVNDSPASDEDSLQAACLKNGGEQVESPFKEKKGGPMKSLRASLRLVREKSPLGSAVKRSMSFDSGQNAVQPTSSPNNLIKRGTSLRHSLGLGTKKNKQDDLEPVTEGETLPEEQEPEVVVDRVLELRDTYSLPEIPSVAMSVMEINKLIETELLEEAYVNLLSMRLELQRECEALDKEDCPIELVHKEKDLSLLYRTLRNKMSNIVRNSSALPSSNKELLVYVSYIVLEEEKRQGELGAMPGWREAWREAVKDGVRDTLKKVHLDGPEQKTSWLAVHLGLLGKAIVEDLGMVKTELLNSYPPDFNVFETYVSCHHEAVEEHVKKLFDRVSELKDYFALLDFIIKKYPGEKIMGNSSLQPEMKDEQRALPLHEDFLNQIKSKYCKRLQADMRKSLDRIIELEKEEMWKEKNKPVIEEGLYSSHIDMDIWTNIKGHVQGSKMIDCKLEQEVVLSCLEELTRFPKRFESAFGQWGSDLSPLSAEYHFCYINSFSALKEHMECYKESCPNQLEQLGREIDEFTTRLYHTLMEQFKSDVKPFLRRLMTRKWFSFDDDFKQLIDRINILSDHCKYMRLKPRQRFVNEAHLFVVKEFVSQLMKNNYSCKNRKNETAASKISKQWGQLKELFQDMNSTLDWLHPVGDQLSKIIGCKKSDIKSNLQPLVKNYPDIRKGHLSAVLYFRGIIRGREKHLILQRLSVMKQNIGNAENTEHVLFSEIQPAVNTDCFAGTPFSCLAFIVPDS